MDVNDTEVYAEPQIVATDETTEAATLGSNRQNNADDTEYYD